ncbi:MAG: ABC transporter ATP-binding protein [Candidatus Heimdallarchaeota archaeon]
MYVIEIKKLTKRFKNITALDTVSLNVKKGEVFGLLGPNGSGKTTLIRTLLGLIRPTSGSATLFGNLNIITDIYKIRKRSSLLPQEASCVEMLSARENILYHGGIHSGDILSEKELQEQTGKILKLIGLETRQNDLTKKFSGGMKRRVLVASSLVMNPDLLFLDEPTTGIDILGAQQIRQLIKQLASEDKTIFLTTHDLTDINELCDRVGILVDGKIVDVGEPTELEERYQLNGIEAVYTNLVRKIRSKEEVTA